MTEKLRAEGIRAEMDYERRSLKAQMRSANKFRARYAIVVGPDELAAGKLKLKQMATGEEKNHHPGRSHRPAQSRNGQETTTYEETKWSARAAHIPAGN